MHSSFHTCTKSHFVFITISRRLADQARS